LQRKKFEPPTTATGQNPSNKHVRFGGSFFRKQSSRPNSGRVTDVLLATLNFKEGDFARTGLSPWSR
jgi:hypothetical protein